MESRDCSSGGICLRNLVFSSLLSFLEVCAMGIDFQFSLFPSFSIDSLGGDVSLYDCQNINDRCDI